MSPTPPRLSAQLIIAGILVMLAMLGLLLCWPTAAVPTPNHGGTTGEPVLPAPMVPTPPPPMTPRSQVIPADLARAVAAVGAFDDGRRATVDDLPETVRLLIDQARQLLAASPRQAAPGLPLRLPDGSEMRIEPDPVRPGDPYPAPTISAGSPADRERARAVDGRLVARTFSTTGKLPVPIRGDVVKEILEPDAWIAVPYNPALVAGQPFALTNRSLGEYVLRLEADDYGSVRLNGGLVVPGRYYHVNGTMTVTSDVPVGVVIRPLGVVPSYYERPLRPPSANG